MNNEAVLRLFDTYADDAFRLAYSYLGSRPEMKLEPSDCARFAYYTLTYDAVNQIVVCTVEEGGGIG